MEVVVVVRVVVSIVVLGGREGREGEEQCYMYTIIQININILWDEVRHGQDFIVSSTKTNHLQPQRHSLIT